MAKFCSLEDFSSGVILNLNDDVYLEDIHYIVGLFSLNRHEASNPDKIFKILKIENKEKFCEACYGYKPDLSLHGFPHYKTGDYEAATRVVIALMKLSEKQKTGFWKLFYHRKKKKKEKH